MASSTLWQGLFLESLSIVDFLMQLDMYLGYMSKHYIVDIFFGN